MPTQTQARGSRAKAAQPPPSNIAAHPSVAVPREIEKQLIATEWLDVDALMVDHKYQRERDPSRISKMAKEWNWLGCGLLSVSLRSGARHSYYAVIDGQQRLEAIKALGYLVAPCQVYIDLTQEQEAELYELLNKSKKPTYNDLFKSRLMRGEEVARNIQLAVQAVGFELDAERKHAGGSAASILHIQTMRELESIYQRGKSALIMDTLRVIKGAFDGQGWTNQAMVLGGVALFLQRYPDIPHKEIIAKLKREGVEGMSRAALAYQSVAGKGGGGHSRPVAFCEAMLLIYNRGRREDNKVTPRRRQKGEGAE